MIEKGEMYMIRQKKADELIKVLKELKTTNKLIQFPEVNEQMKLKAESVVDKKERFIFYTNRKGQYNLAKCTYLMRYDNIQNLLRIDLEGPPHDNPDGRVVECPHIHIYREGYGLSWAYPLETVIKTDPSDLISVLIEFLKYTNINNYNQYSVQEGGLV